MDASTIAATSSTRATPSLRYGVHLLVALAITLVSPFTGLAWPFAILVGMLLGGSEARRIRGEHVTLGDSLAAAPLMALGVVAMLFLGALIGGVIAFAIVALTSFSEQVAALASPTDRGVARILLFVVPLAAWLVAGPLLGLQFDVRIGG